MAKILCSCCGTVIARATLDSDLAAQNVTACAAYGVPCCPSGDGKGACCVKMADTLNLEVAKSPNTAS